MLFRAVNIFEGRFEPGKKGKEDYWQVVARSMAQTK
jgi:hypothetical protein